MVQDAAILTMATQYWKLYMAYQIQPFSLTINYQYCVKTAKCMVKVATPF